MSTNNKTQLFYRKPDLDPYLIPEVERDPYLIPQTVIICASIIGNLFIVILCLSSPKLRKTPKYFVIINVSVAALILAAYPESLALDLFARKKWIHGYGMWVHMHMAYYIINSIYMFLMTSLCLESIMWNGRRDGQSGVHYSTMAALVGTCWVGSCVFIVPIAAAWHESYFGRFSLDNNFDLAVHIMSYFPQAFSICVVLTLLMAIHLWKRRFQGDEHDDLIRPFPVDVLVASCLTVVLKFPHTVFLLIVDECDMKTHYLIHASVSSLWLLPHALVPFVWLLGRDTREAINVCRSRWSREAYEISEEQHSLNHV